MVGTWLDRGSGVGPEALEGLVKEPHEALAVQTRCRLEHVWRDSQSAHEGDMFWVLRLEPVDADDGLATAVGERGGNRLAPAADVFLVESAWRRWGVTCLGCFPCFLKPEAAGVGRQHLVDDLATLTELELGIGDDDATRQPVRLRLLVDGERNQFGNHAVRSADGTVVDVLIVTDQGFGRRCEDSLGQLTPIVKAGRQTVSAHHLCFLIGFEAGAGEIATNDALDIRRCHSPDDEGVLLENGIVAKLRGQIYVDSSAIPNQVMSEVAEYSLQPEDGHGCEDRAFAPDQRWQDEIEYRNAIRLVHQQSIRMFQGEEFARLA